MKTIKITDAKANLAALVGDAAQARPTTITRRGVAVAVLTPIQAARKLYPQKARSFADLFLLFPCGVNSSAGASPPRDVDL